MMQQMKQFKIIYEELAQFHNFENIHSTFDETFG